tara:strand:+ start:1343 stop:1690 length:348 start_codon:yes stop_codon:yes gene_type:complete
MGVFVATKTSAEQLALFTYREYAAGDEIFVLSGATVSHPTRESIRVAEGEHILDSYGSYMNHSCKPNAIIDGYKVVASKWIATGAEVTFDYRTTEGELACPFVCDCCGVEIIGQT